MSSLWIRSAAAAGLVLTACASGEPSTDETTESEVQVAQSVVVASQEAAFAAEVLPDSIRIPLAVGRPYAALPPETVFVGPRGSATGKNPEGFLRRIIATRTDGGTLVFLTKNATLTDAIVTGSVHATSGGQAIDDGLQAARDFKIDLDFSKKTLFENVEKVGNTTFTESIKFDNAMIDARTFVDVDVRIRDGEVSKFTAKVEGRVATRMTLDVAVNADGAVDATTLSALRAQKHDVSKVLYKSKRNPLPTFSVGGVPVSTSVQLVLTMKCGVSFAGPITTQAGFDASGYVRLSAINTDGKWAPPAKSDLSVHPLFEMSDAGSITAKCVLEAETELSAYGMPGVKMSVAPYVDFDATLSAREWNAAAGVTGALRGSSDVFGLTAPSQELAHWTSPPLKSQ